MSRPDRRKPREPRSAILSMIALATMILSACTVAGTDQAPRPLPSPRISDGVTMLDGGPTARAVPTSGDAEPGVRYRFTLYSHCGLGYWAAWDFDESFWDPHPPVPDAAADPPDGIGNPLDEGVIELVGDDEASYTSANGIVVELRRSSDSEREGFMCA